MAHEHVDEQVIETRALGRTLWERTHDRVRLIAPGARNRAWVFAAMFYGVPWLVTVATVSVWYLGWGIPSNPLVRIMLWLMTMLLTFAMHTAALLALWGAIYSRYGTEEIIIEPERITVVRHARSIPIRHHIKRSITEQVCVLQPHGGAVARPRVELRAWRSAIRFGAGLTEEEAQACAEALRDHFEQDERARGVC